MTPLPSARANLHPNNHTVSDLVEKTYDVICIGSGWASRVAAARIVKAGHTALIIEEELVGGECPFWACVPSKVLLRPEEVLHAARSVGGIKDATGGGRLDPEAVFARRDVFTGNLTDAHLVEMVADAHVSTVRGVGSLVSKRRVRVVSTTGDSVEIEAKMAVVLGIGSEPIYPPIPGLKDAHLWTPRDATSAQEVPAHLIVLGAGAVGVEMASAYASFGSKVTLVSSTAEILPSVDPEAGRVVREALLSRGVDVKTSTRISKVTKDGPNQVTAELSSGENVSGTQLLLAAGRKGKHESLNLQSVGAKATEKSIPVDEHLLVATDDGEQWLYAAGDITGRAMLTHTSKYHGRIVSKAILARSKGEAITESDYVPHTATADRLAVPQVVFSDPPVSSVGLTRTTAERKGIQVREITAPFITLGGRIASDAAVEGWAQWLLDGEDRLVGATFAGYGAADVLHASTVAIVGGLTIGRLAHAIPSFPTVSEVYLNLLEAAGW